MSLIWRAQKYGKADICDTWLLPRNSGLSALVIFGNSFHLSIRLYTN